MLRWSRRLLVGLNILNWFFLAVFMIVLVAMTIWPDRLVDALIQASPRMDAAYVIDLFRLVLLLCIPIAFVAHAIFTRLVAMIDSVDRAEVFTLVNARRLRLDILSTDRRQRRTFRLAAQPDRMACGADALHPGAHLRTGCGDARRA